MDTSLTGDSQFNRTQPTQNDMWLKHESYSYTSSCLLFSQVDNYTTWSIDRLAWAGGVLVWSGDAQYKLDDEKETGFAAQWIWPAGILWAQPSILEGELVSVRWGR